jgi:hypothetical protein
MPSQSVFKYLVKVTMKGCLFSTIITIVCLLLGNPASFEVWIKGIWHMAFVFVGLDTVFSRFPWQRS